MLLGLNVCIAQRFSPSTLLLISAIFPLNSCLNKSKVCATELRTSCSDIRQLPQLFVHHHESFSHTEWIVTLCRDSCTDCEQQALALVKLKDHKARKGFFLKKFSLIPGFGGMME